MSPSKVPTPRRAANARERLAARLTWNTADRTRSGAGQASGTRDGSPGEWRHSRHGCRRRGWRFHPGNPTGASMGHFVLLGDSIFDNGAYVRPGEPDVVRQLRARLPAGAAASLRAVDGATTAGVARQLEGLPAEATHLVVSAGGNDALGHVGVLEDASRSIADTLNRLAAIAGEFERSYRAMLAAVLARRLPTALCTIYDP